MKNEEFPKVVLDKLTALDNQQKNMSSVLDTVVSQQEGIKADIKNIKFEIKEEFKEVKKQINSIVEQTAVLIEFKTEASEKLKRNIG